MIYDLNMEWTASTSSEDLDHILRHAAILGYDVVALNHTISRLPIPSPIINPIPLVPGSSSSKSSTTAPRSTRKLPTTLRRATVAMSDPRDNHRLDAVAAAYDILAVRPLTEASFNHACVSLSEPSIISLDLASNMGYYFRPKSVMAAVRRGCRFEICYAQLVGASANQRSRALFVANLVALLRATKGRGLVLSSGAASPSLLRPPADVVNLLAVWGLGPETGLEALSGNPRGVVVNEGIKRSAFRGVVDVVQLAGPAPGSAAGAQQQQKGTTKKSNAPASAGGDGKGKKGKGPQQQRQDKTQDQQQQPQGTKRKNGEEVDAADASGQQLSKRQAKKQRRVAIASGGQEGSPAAAS